MATTDGAERPWQVELQAKVAGHVLHIEMVIGLRSELLDQLRVGDEFGAFQSCYSPLVVDVVRGVE
jgi:hypothetical protein